MNKQQINKRVYERCLLTEVTPYETPLLFSNWGAYNYFHTLKRNAPPLWKTFFDAGTPTIPYRFKIKKDLQDFRTLCLVHPAASPRVVDLYSRFDTMIVRACQKSRFSLRAPHSIARYFILGRGDDSRTKYVEQLDESRAYASSYFTYKHFSHLHRFYESDMFSNLEQSFARLQHFDIAKCFPSIYTHSISWAIRGKHYAKQVAITDGKRDHSLGGSFDHLMQLINHNETHGVVVGPEMSRIFAEIILQDIDIKVERKMLDSNSQWGRDYCCVRYIDDIFFFYNQSPTADHFEAFLRSECEQYKLYLNDTKRSTHTRPFITDLSIGKINISRYVEDLAQRVQDSEGAKRLSSARELNAVRAVVHTARDQMHGLTSFFLAALTNKLHLLKKHKEEDAVTLLSVFVDLAFHWVRIDTRVASVYKLTRFTLTVLEYAEGFSSHHKTQILDLLFAKISGALEASISSQAFVESMNLLISASVMGRRYLFPEGLISRIIHSSKQVHADDIVPHKRLSYFEIVTLLYYIRNYKPYHRAKKEIINDACYILEHCPINAYSESAHLLCDLLSCPYLNKATKNRLLASALVSVTVDKSPTAVNRYRNFGERHSWFFNWNTDDDLTSLLRKKEFMLTY